MKKIFLLLILNLFFLSCGFKTVDKSSLSRFDIAEINLSGDKRINYILKNKILLNSDENNKKLISISIETFKKKEIKEKNIKNEITKYQIIIDTKIEIKDFENSKNERFSIKKNGEYNVANQYSQTLNNEKKLIKLLTEKLAEDILDELRMRLDAI
jgi:hypothetical protein